MASAVVARSVGLAELTDAFVRRPDVQALLARVEVEPDDREDALRLGSAPYDVVVVETRDGRRLEGRRVSDERGSPRLPLSIGELWTKFESCFAAGNPRLAARPIFDALTSIERQPNVAALVGLSQAA
jgi:2-methylcitrate dehydratase PrpD